MNINFRDKFVGIKSFSTHDAAEFKYAWPVYDIMESHCGGSRYVLRTHFRLNLSSLQDRIHNLGLEKNGAPHDLSEELKALKVLTGANLFRN